MTIVIPCYQEAERLKVASFVKFFSEFKECKVLFVNDASQDSTLEILQNLENEFPKNVAVISNAKNSGKAASVRSGIQHSLKKNPTDHYAYLDADLAVSLEECISYVSHLNDGKKFVFASRILKIGSVVERKFSRFIIGRIIATFISNILDVKVYDTQCGCKVFTKEIAQVAFDRPFISKWLFDVEIFSRIIKTYGKERALSFMDEIPVKKWIDQGESKVRPSYFFRLWADLLRIWKIHRSGK